jgi:hypothetical protein
MSEEGGYPKSQIRSFDHHRVSSFLNKREVIRDDDPLNKFTYYQSYR